MCSENGAGPERDKLDFEFLGNRTGQRYLIQTNVYKDGVEGREMRHMLWFDPTEEFHSYSILWNNCQIVQVTNFITARIFFLKENWSLSYMALPSMGSTTMNGSDDHLCHSFIFLIAVGSKWESKNFTLNLVNRFFVDRVPIRVYKNNGEKNDFFPNEKPMYLFASIWTQMTGPLEVGLRKQTAKEPHSCPLTWTSAFRGANGKIHTLHAYQPLPRIDGISTRFGIYLIPKRWMMLGCREILLVMIIARIMNDIRNCQGSVH
ncbi:hypothetical protein CRYUN_Cryun32bG0025500 [Craigia yunnanensis]